MTQSKILVGQVLAVFAIILFAQWSATQWTAEQLGHQPRLGSPWFTFADYRIYHPWRLFQWWYVYEPYAPDVFNRAGFISGVGSMVGTIVAVLMSVWRSRVKKYVTTYGSSRWAQHDDVKSTGLLRDEGIFLGKWKNHYLRHEGPEHVMAFAPTRSGKGVGLVIPTLLSWTESAIIHDIKGENWELTSGWRSKFSHCLLFDPTNLASARYNPLSEVRKGDFEVRDVQNIADILVDPEGSLEKRNHWEKTGHALLVGVIIHVLYAEEDKTLAGCARFLSDPRRSFEATLAYMMATKHLGEGKDAKTHPVVEQAARELFNKSENERSGVLSTAMSFLVLYRDPIVAAVTAESDWRISDIVDGPHPCSLYLVVPPADISRTKPLIRLILNQIGRRLTEDLPENEDRRRNTLMMLDEFPTLGRLDFFESALAFMAGYRIRAFLIAQSLNQIEKAYGPNNSILDNCHVRVTFATNDERTAKRISDALGTTTEQRQQKNYSGHRLAPWLAHVMVSQQETSRPLLTPGEVMQLPPDDEIVMVSGSRPIKGKKLRYYQDSNFTCRILSPPKASMLPEKKESPWEGCIRKADPKLYRKKKRSKTDDDGGMQKSQTPELASHSKPPPAPESDYAPEPHDDDFNDDHIKRNLKQLRDAAALDRVDDDLLPGF